MSKFINMMKVKSDKKIKKLLFKCGIKTHYMSSLTPSPILLFTQFEKEKIRKFYVNYIKHRLGL